MRSLALLLLGHLIAACSAGDSTSGPRVTVTDSAGVEIVTTAGSTPALAPRLVRRIGAVEGDERLQFFRVGGIRIDHDTVYVANNGSGEIRVFAPDGSFVRAIGRRGDGPGELQIVSSFELVEDGLVVMDAGLHRATAFARDGAVLYTVPLAINASLMNVASGGWVLWHRDFRPGAPAGIGDVRQDSFHYRLVRDPRSIPALIAAGGAAFDTLPLHASVPRPREYAVAGPGGLAWQSPLWEPAGSWAFDADGNAYVAAGFPYRVDVYAAGRHVRSIRRDVPPAPLDRALADRFLAEVTAFWDTTSRRAEFGGDPTAYDRDRAALPLPPHLPVTGRLLASARGHLWVERLDLVDDPVALVWTRAPRRTTIWDVVEPGGRVVATVRCPPEFLPRTPVPGGVWGVLRDELDVEYVAYFALDAALPSS